MALNSLFCADVPLRNYSLTHSLTCRDSVPGSTLCLKKNIHDVFDCNLKTNYQISIIFGKHISDTTCHQMTV